MPSYRYVARDIKGRPHAGIVVAPTEQDARKTLRDRQLYITELGGEDPGLFQNLLRMVRPHA